MKLFLIVCCNTPNPTNKAINRSSFSVHAITSLLVPELPKERGCWFGSPRGQNATQNRSSVRDALQKWWWSHRSGALGELSSVSVSLGDAGGNISTRDGTSLKLVDKFPYLGSSVSSTEKHRYAANEGMDSYRWAIDHMKVRPDR